MASENTLHQQLKSTNCSQKLALGASPVPGLRSPLSTSGLCLLREEGGRRREGGATLSQKTCPGALLRCHMKLPLSSSTEPVATEPLGMALLSSILAAWSYISENPERAALYFVSGVCIGLFLTLAALVMRISCHTDCRRGPRRRCLQDHESSSDSSDSEDGSEDTASDLSVRRHRRFERTLNKNVFTSAEELERAQRLEERERIIREIWMNGQPEVPGTRSLNRYY
ncbi:protein eva-1 homolog A isoform X1 [Arvicanthis niloticus]|uniref:protein eva-1 homolog A isoform X1 n=1 Tax=Arvicanthis niloticus TaxID=61156 RepID=UPI00402BCED1